MKRPLKDVRPIGPFTEALSFSQDEDEDVDYTMLYAGPAVPSHVDAPQDMINSFTSLVERKLRMELGLSKSQYNVFTESIVADGLRKDGNMLVVKLSDVDMNDSEAIEAGETLMDEMEDTALVGDVDGMVYAEDFFLDSNAEKLADV